MCKGSSWSYQKELWHSDHHEEHFWGKKQKLWQLQGYPQQAEDQISTQPDQLFLAYSWTSHYKKNSLHSFQRNGPKLEQFFFQLNVQKQQGWSRSTIILMNQSCADQLNNVIHSNDWEKGFSRLGIIDDETQEFVANRCFQLSNIGIFSNCISQVIRWEDGKVIPGFDSPICH